MFTRLDYSSALEYSIIRHYTNIVYYYYYPSPKRVNQKRPVTILVTAPLWIQLHYT